MVISNYKKLPDYLATGSTVKVKILHPVSTQGLGEDEVQTLADKCRDIMSDVFHKLWHPTAKVINQKRTISAYCKSHTAPYLFENLQSYFRAKWVVKFYYQTFIAKFYF